MKWNKIRGRWNQLKEKAHERWSELSEDDLDRVDGQRDQLRGKLQEKYGIGREEAERQVEDFERACRRGDAKLSPHRSSVAYSAFGNRVGWPR